MTEDEAKTKWCPMAVNNTCTRNPRGEIPDGAKCVASDCMMWRRDEQPTKFGPFGKEPYTPVEFRFGGYCGLAGKP